jgi:phospholipase/lecithinase/hemolysin
LYNAPFKKERNIMKQLRSIVLVFSLLASINSQASSFSNIYVIGDSLSDQGNLRNATLSLSNNTDERPASDHYFQGRFSNGEVYSGLLAQRLGLSLSASSEGGNNFAYGGTRTDFNRVEENSTTPFDFQDGIYAPDAFPWALNTQRQAFEARGINDPNALFVVWSGSNDVGDLIRPTISSGGSFNAASFISDAIGGIGNVIGTFKAAGAETVLVPNIADLGLIPNVTVLNPPGATIVSDTATALAQAYNTALDSLLDQFADIDIIRFDTFGFSREIAADPAALGFTNVEASCYSGFVDADVDNVETVCDSEVTYAYWDGEHPTTRFHNIVADRMFAAAVPEPYSILLVFTGFVAFMLRNSKKSI